jgi:outer membrane lipoprotein-sorting protein
VVPYEVLKEADRARGNLEGVVWDVDLTTKREGKKDLSVSYSVKARGYDFVAVATSPRKQKGDVVLMAKHNMWFYQPDLSKPVPISQRQKLMGAAAYGDIASTNYAEDYDARQLPDEVVDGEECFVFDLSARTKKATYDRIVYRVSKKRIVGVSADYYTVTDKLFKTARMEYENRTVGEGGARPTISRMAIYSTLASKDRTFLDFSDMVLKNIPDSAFNVNLLRN